MNYLHRDNFRYFTGRGRDFAQMIDHVLERLDIGSAGGLKSIIENFNQEEIVTTLPPGNFVIYNDVDQQIIETHYAGFRSADGAGFEIDAAYTKSISNFGDIAGPLRLISICTARADRREVVTLPLRAVLVTAPDYSQFYQVYHHAFLEDEAGEDIKHAHYVGVTKRGWRTRWAEHVRSATNGSSYRFHRAIRMWNDSARSVSHTVMACGLSERVAMDVEERLVENNSLYPLGLNMIPGGKSGLAYLRAIGALGANERVTADDKHAIINRFFERASRKGLPNPLAAANWLDSNYAERVICAGPDRLKPNQIRDARFFSSLGQDAANIATQVGARNVAQIERLLAGQTYARVV